MLSLQFDLLNIKVAWWVLFEGKQGLSSTLGQKVEIELCPIWTWTMNEQSTLQNETKKNDEDYKKFKLIATAQLLFHKISVDLVDIRKEFPI